QRRPRLIPRTMSPAPQLPLALRYPPDQRLEAFVAPPPGALAQLQALAGTQGADWIYVAGPSGVGKTHLALAACAAAEAAGRAAAYVPLKAAAGRLRDTLDAFDDRALVALDGLDAIAGNRDDEVALFDFHNRARAAGSRRSTTRRGARCCANARVDVVCRWMKRRSIGCCGVAGATW